MTGAVLAVVLVSTMTSKPRRQAAPGHLVEVKSPNALRQALAAHPASMVVFHSPASDDCRRVIAVLESLAVKYGRDIAFLAVEADRLPEGRDEWEVESIPEVRLYLGAQIRQRWAGVAAGEEYEKALEPIAKVGGGGSSPESPIR